MTNEVAKSTTINIVPVQGVFGPEPNYTLVSLIGPAGSEFYANINPNQSGLNITNSTINSTTIGASSPSTAAFTAGTVAATPTLATDIVNKQYVDAFAAGITWKQAVRAASTVDITPLSGLLTVDTITLVAGDRVLVKNQGTASQNGIYIASSSTWLRAEDANTWTEFVGAITFVDGGSQAGSAWYCTAQPGGTVGVTANNWSVFSVSATYSAGTGLSLIGSTFSITNTGVSATNYGSASQVGAFTVNAQGQLTTASNTAIAINGNQITSGTVGSSYISGSYTGITGVGTLAAGTWNGNAITVGYGGTGATTFTAGYLKANGTSAFGTVTSIPSSDITGLGTMSTQNANAVVITGGTISGLSSPLAVASGGTGAATLTGYVKGAGTTAFTAASTIPNTDISGLGTMSTQNANAVAITGGTEAAVSHTGDTISDYLNFTSVSAPSYAEGRVWYDTDQKSLAFYNDLNLSPVFIGENIVLKVYNNTGSTIAKGAAVYIQSGGAFTYPNVGLAKADSVATSAVIGLMNSATPTGSFGYVTSTGVITGLNTGALTEGQILYLSPYSAGQLMNTVPPTGYVVQVGVVAHSNSSVGTIYTKQTTPLAISAATITGTVAVANGGTGIASYTAGDVLYASGTTTLTKLGIGTTGQVLTVNGGGTAPSWATPTAYATVTDDTTTNGTRYLMFANQTTGNLTTTYVSSTKLKYNPSTGALTASQLIIAP